MIIACTIDNNYIRHCAVMLRSLYLSNKDEDISVYILHGSIDSNERAKLAAYLGQFLASVSFIHIDHALLAGFPVFGHITVATYYRMLLPEALPHAINKVLYIDSDLIVVDSLHDLWEAPISDLCMAAVVEHNQDFDRKRLGLREGSLVFNAGVMLINLNRWRQENFLSQGLEFVKNHPEKIKHWDQDVLNSLLEGKWLQLESRWNALPHLWMQKEYLDTTTASGMEAKAARDRPAMIHFAGSGIAKPWNYRCNHPWRQQYLDIRNETPWASSPLEEQPPSSKFKRLRSIASQLKSSAKGLLMKNGVQ